MFNKRKGFGLAGFAGGVIGMLLLSGCGGSDGSDNRGAGGASASPTPTRHTFYVTDTDKPQGESFALLDWQVSPEGRLLDATHRWVRFINDHGRVGTTPEPWGETNRLTGHQNGNTVTFDDPAEAGGTMKGTLSPDGNTLIMEDIITVQRSEWKAITEIDFNKKVGFWATNHPFPTCSATPSTEVC